MKVAVMQPYIFPYIGYYQLVRCVDVFVLYDDVNYISRGYVNRNYILHEGRKRRFTVPVLAASINKQISTLSFSRDVSEVLENIRHAYSKAPYFDVVFPMIQRVIDKNSRGITDMCSCGISEVFDYLDVEASLQRSCRMEYHRTSDRAQNLMAICTALGARQYVNSLGGTTLYDKKEFSSKGFSLSFLKPRQVRYRQGSAQFVPNLSIIDVLMWCSKSQTREFLDEYDLI